MSLRSEAMLEQQLIEQFLESLQAVPDVQAEVELEPTAQGRTGSSHAYDAKVDLCLAGKACTLLIEVKKSLYPRDVRQTLWQLREAPCTEAPERSESREKILVLIAETISSGARELLRKERVGHYDSGGSMFLSAGGIYLHIDKPPPKSLSKSMRSLFSKRRAQVLHALLINHRDWFGVTALAKQARAAPATVSGVLAELERFDWLASRGQGPRKERRLREPAALLNTWTQQLDSLRPPAMHQYYVSGMRANELVQEMGKVFAKHAVEYAITHEAAGQRYAPFLSNFSQVRCRLLTDQAANQAIGELGARVVSEGSNLAIIEAQSPDELLFRQQSSGICLASPVQVYLDLMLGGGRAKDMAEHLRQEKIGF